MIASPSRETLAYIAGPYRDPRGAHWIGENIHRARRVAADMWARGYAVICPHLNTSLMDGLCDDSAFLDGTLEMLRRCDLVVLTYDWHHSAGAIREVNEAMMLRIPVYQWPRLDPVTEAHFNAGPSK